MRILIIAYEFLPSPSPQSLRWAYLCGGLARLGHEVHVLAPDWPVGSARGLPSLPKGVVIHRAFAGPFLGLLAARAKRVANTGIESFANTVEPLAREALVSLVAPRTPELNWRGKLWHAALDARRWTFLLLKEFADLVFFPDIRGEWRFWGRRRLRRLLQEVRPDVVVSSHEPATTLELGLVASRLGFPWVADLGDPVLAPYTPVRWRRRSWRLERKVCVRADGVIVTTESARRLLRSRHPKTGVDVHLLTQGFDETRSETNIPIPISQLFDPERLELLYTGSFYAFRSPEALIHAVVATPGVRLNVATVHAPELLLEAARRHPESMRLFGFLAHADALDMQQGAHVLVSVGNALPDQVPGKLYEYLGARRPILHISSVQGDAAEELLMSSGRGITCSNDEASIRDALAELRKSRCPSATTYFSQRVMEHSWGNLAARLGDLLESIVQTGSPLREQYVTLK